MTVTGVPESTAALSMLSVSDAGSGTTVSWSEPLQVMQMVVGPQKFRVDVDG